MFQFNPVDGFNNGTSYVRQPTNARADIMTLHNQTRNYLNKRGVYLEDSGTANNIVVTTDSNNKITDLTDALLFIRMNNSNTGAVTLKVDDLTAQAVKKNVSDALASSDLPDNYIGCFAWDGTNFQLLNPWVNLTEHVNNTTDAHGAVASATANKIVLRDAKGQVVGFVPTCVAYNTTAQSVSSASVTALAMNNEIIDTDTMHDLAINNSRITCKTAGTYIAFGHGTFAMNATGDRSLFIQLNGSARLAENSGKATASGNVSSNITVASNPFVLAVNDYIELMAYQDSGGAINVSGQAVSLLKVG